MRSRTAVVVLLALIVGTPGAMAQPTPPAETPPAEPPPADPLETPAEPPAPEPPAPAPVPPSLEIHGFVSQGAFVSTANDYIGASSRGSLAFFELGLNVSTEIGDRLRAGVQLFARKVGDFDDPPRIDWALVDYAWRPWLGLRAGVVKMPIGLYNEYADIDAARVPILLPQTMYPIRNRSLMLAQTGFAVYGHRPLGGAGDLDYQAWLGTLTIPRNALDVAGATLDDVDPKYVTGGQLFWHPPVDDLRIGVSYLRTAIDFHLTFSQENIDGLIAAGLVPADYDGTFNVYYHPVTFLVGSIEYLHGNWLVAAEYGRWLTRERYSIGALNPPHVRDSEHAYAMASYQLAERWQLGSYLSVLHSNVDHRTGGMAFPRDFDAYQRDLAATLRFDVNDHWLWKLEGHVIDGTADLTLVDRADSERYWGLFLAKTTVTF